MRNIEFAVCSLSLVSPLFSTAQGVGKIVEDTRPNVVLIYADDLGFGDLECYGAKGVKTPNANKLAANGLRFTNAHSVASTSTPSRYSLLTGEYPWRKQGTDVAAGSAVVVERAGVDGGDDAVIGLGHNFVQALAGNGGGIGFR